jgi:hypothetical protein
MPSGWARITASIASASLPVAARLRARFEGSKTRPACCLPCASLVGIGSAGYVSGVGGFKSAEPLRSRRRCRPESAGRACRAADRPYRTGLADQSGIALSTTSDQWVPRARVNPPSRPRTRASWRRRFRSARRRTRGVRHRGGSTQPHRCSAGFQRYRWGAILCLALSFENGFAGYSGSKSGPRVGSPQIIQRCTDG